MLTLQNSIKLAPKKIPHFWSHFHTISPSLLGTSGIHIITKLRTKIVKTHLPRNGVIDKTTKDIGARWRTLMCRTLRKESRKSSSFPVFRISIEFNAPMMCFRIPTILMGDWVFMSRKTKNLDVEFFTENIQVAHFIISY